MIASEVRVRIAPSPSGYLHVGTARMAIANYLFARHSGGKFLVRIEDTDVERSDQSMVAPIVDALGWLGIESDEPIVYQSQRKTLHAECIRPILESGRGYRCFCSPEQLAKDREEAKAAKGPMQYNRRCLSLSKDEVDARVTAGEKFAVRIRIPDGVTRFTDMVSGNLTRANEEIEDFVIARSDGTATYNLAVVVDDHDMNITHVIRGNDHITNTFKQVLIYDALGYDLPQFGHVPLILRPDKRKVAKRLGDKDVAQYRQEGIIPEAMFNYLCLLGWSSKTDEEIFSVNKLIEIFDPNNFSRSNAIFDEEKLVALNHQHLMKKSDHELATLVAPILVDAGLTTKYWLETRWDYLRQIVAMLRERAKRTTEYAQMSGYYFSADFTYEEKAEAKQFTPEAADRLDRLAERFEALGAFSHDDIEAALSGLAEEMEVGKGKLIHPTRLAVSGVSKGPGLYDMLAVLTQPVVIERMKKASEYIRKKNA